MSANQKTFMQAMKGESEPYSSLIPAELLLPEAQVKEDSNRVSATRSPASPATPFLPQLVCLFACLLLSVGNAWIWHSARGGGLPDEVWWRAALLGLGGGAVLVWLLRRLTTQGLSSGAELFRWGFVTAIALWSARPYLQAGSVGAGDSYWYTVMLADFMAQTRAGEFPVWAGQSEFAFNGAVFPLRIAPFFQHFGGALDFLFGGKLEALEVRNLTLFSTFLLCAGSAYACFCASMRREMRTLAALATALWLASPGLLAPLFSGDQYMTFVALPFLPPLFLGWRLWSGSQRKLGEWIIGGALSATWWCHTPIAMWCTFLSLLYLGGEMIRRRLWREDFFSALRVTGMLAVLGLFPVASIALVDNKAPGTGTVESVIFEIHRYALDSIKPITAQTNGLAAYQLGYALMGCALVSLIYLVRRGRGDERLTVGLLGWLFCLALPVPWLTARLWSLFPQAVIAVNNVWPQQRIYPIATVLILSLWVGAADRLLAKSLHRRIAISLFVAGLGWSLWQAHTLTRTLEKSRQSYATATRSLDRNHVQLTRYSYASFKTPPAYYSHGYMDPWMENRLLDPATGEVVTSNSEAAAPVVTEGSSPYLDLEGTLSVDVNNGGKSFAFRPQLRLEPSTYYALRIAIKEKVKGILNFPGGEFYREYYLPDSGFGMNAVQPPRAFGLGDTSSKVMTFKHDSKTTTLVTVSFFAEEVTAPFEIKYQLFKVDPSMLPIRVSSLTPYRAEVETARAVILETPRIWFSGWRANVDGKPTLTQSTRQNLVGIPLAPGRHQIELRHVPPLWLRAQYWLALSGWLGLFTAAAIMTFLHAGRPRPT